MARSKVTAKFQITIPKAIRKQVPLRPGEIVEVESREEGILLIKRFATVKDPIAILVGKGRPRRHIAIEELEQAAESRQ